MEKWGSLGSRAKPILSYWIPGDLDSDATSKGMWLQLPQSPVQPLHRS